MTPGGARMDPRIRERRVAVRREAGRRRRRVFVALTSLAAVATLAYGATRSPLFDVDAVRIAGASSTSPDDIRGAAGLAGPRQLADLDPESAAHRIERLPWVQRATVERHWPGTVEITLLERTPLASMPAAGGGWAVVDATGRVLTHASDAFVGMPSIAAPEPAPGPGGQVAPAARSGLAVVEALPGPLRGKVTRVRVVAANDLQLELDGGPPVNFGAPTQVRPKLVALSTLVARTNLRGVRAIDVRVPTAPVLTRA